MRKNSQFDEIYSEEDMQFNNTATKLQIKQDTTPLQKIVKDGSRLSTIVRAHLQDSSTTDQIKKRKSENDTNPDSKLLSYRQRSKQRYNTPATNAPNTPLLPPNHHTERHDSMEKFITEKQHETIPNYVEIKAIDDNHDTTISVNQRLPNKDSKPLKQEKGQKIINEANLPKLSKEEELYRIYGGGKKLPNKIKPLDGKGKDSKDRAARMQRVERAKEILSGKLSVVWIYVISGQIDEDLRDRIYAVYKGLMDDSNIVPFVASAWEVEPFLNLPNAYFKIVANLANVEDALRYKINIRVVEYYIYNDEGEVGTSRALQYKAWSKKVKGIYTDIQRIVQKTEQEIEDTIQIYRFNNGLQASVKARKFPAFLKLSGKDKSQATLYRGNLYGAIIISEDDKKNAYEYFLMLVRQKYGPVQKQQENIRDYTRIKHLSLLKSLAQAKEILQFYVRESFYYQVLNSMLRTLKTTEQFKPCILPFNETYTSIKLYYQQYLTQHKRQLPAMTLYRGAKLKKRDYRSLKQGDFIQMFGFMSTSKSKAAAEKFTDADGYLFVIHVPARTLPEKYDRYDHGFVDINREGLAGKEFSGEEEVLFNALNIYKVTAIEDKGRNILIHLQYGAVFDLLDRPKASLTPDERDVLINYQYCTRLMGEIEDQGDVHLLSSEFDEAKEYYLDRIGRHGKDARDYYKLANVQKQCGEIDEAEKNAQTSLQLLTEKLDLSDRETCLKVFSIHSRNAEINLLKQDYLNADEELTRGIEMLDDSDVFTKARKIRQRGQIKFKKGEVKESEKDFQISEKLFAQAEKVGGQKRWSVKKKYIFSFLTLWCSDYTREQLQSQKEEELSEIQEMERKIAEMKEQIQQQLIKVNKSLRDVALYAQDKEKYEYCVKKGRAYLLNLQQRETNDPALKARLKVMQAIIQDYLDLAESERLLNEAIALVEAGAPFDPAVGQYSTILAKLQKKQLQKLSNPSLGVRLSPDHPLPYSAAQNKAIYLRCKSNFQKAIRILLYNHKAKDSPEVVTLKNQLGELQYSTNNYQDCEEMIREIKSQAGNLDHTQLAKTSLLLGKIAFSRGQLKNSFKTFEEADGILQKVLIKSRENPKYIQLYQRNDIYLQIVLFRAKVYHRQLLHDLSLRELSLLEGKLDQKMEGYQAHSLLASVFEQQGEVRASLGQREFLKGFEKAIDLRRRQMGQYNIPNAVSHCNFAKFLLMVGQLREAETHLAQAVQIFSCLSQQHPINWVIFFSNGICSQMKEQYQEAGRLLKSSLQMAAKKFDSSHITIKKVRLKIAKVLLKLGDIQQSFKQLGQLEQQVEEDLQASRAKVEVLEEIDDQKVTLEKIILTQLRTVIEKEENNVRFSQMEIQKYRKKYDELRRTFKLQGDEKQ